MDYWRRSCAVTRLDKVNNQNIRERMGITLNILDTIEGKRLNWYGHLRRMPEERWPLKIWNWQPPRRRKRGRPRLSWNNGVYQAMQDRYMQEEDWQNRRRWKLGCERRRMV
ncbi:hypothetical protein RN001_006585 [Aquatica leii]|uniref:Uncharacterized protein n=1 Tax=Aquatica leii TaxID=1421715 RepID=A0AAN7PLA2_9COLE|nr:hypothetical protein RN001_006585 [Aquatica leii]